MKRDDKIEQNALLPIGGFTQAGAWFVQTAVRFRKFCARPNGSEAPPA